VKTAVNSCLASKQTTFSCMKEQIKTSQIVMFGSRHKVDTALLSDDRKYGVVINTAVDS
jgi:hypothetical protein